MDPGEKDMTDVTQMQMITFLCSFHEAFWMVWWMERDHAHGLYGSDGRENKLLMGNKRVLCLTLGYGLSLIHISEPTRP